MSIFCLTLIYSFNFRLSENLRPVCLRKVVIGYPCNSKTSEFKFDLLLSYKLNNVIQTFSENKPTLVVRLLLFSTVF